MRRIFTIAILFATVAMYAQDKVTQRIIELGTTDNRTMEHEDFLANRIGGRPIGSHALEDAEKWVASKFKSWGLEVMIQEAGEINVGFNRGPWSGRMIGGNSMALHFGTPGYTAGTKGPQKGRVLIEPKNRQELERMKGALKGSWVLIGGTSTGMALDWSPEADLRRAAVADTNGYEPALFYREMVEAGVLGFIQSARLPLQILYDRANCYKITMDNLPTACDIKLDENQYKVIEQMVREMQDFQLEFDIRNHFNEGPVKYHNVIGILRGSKYPDEYVLMGGHLDAYDVACGAVDDANGTVVAMEAARLMSMSGAKPARSIMFCIWTGEEYGLLGSKFFVESKTVPWDKISNYFNRDGGPTAATGISVPEAMYDDFVKICKPVLNLNPEMPFTVSKREKPQERPVRAGGSDHAYFAMSGIPAISFTESDPKGYNFNYRKIWHTEFDLYPEVIPEYLEHSAVVSAVVVYGIANLNHLLSREGLWKE